jgi:hypothetical protein
MLHLAGNVLVPAPTAIGRSLNPDGSGGTVDVQVHERQRPTSSSPWRAVSGVSL